MENGNDQRDPGFCRAHPISSLTTDFIFTVAVPYQGKSRAQVTIEAAAKVLGRPINEDPNELEVRLIRRRMELALSGKFSPREQTGLSYWGPFNAHLLNCTVRQGEEISKYLKRQNWLYRIPDRRKYFFRELAARGFGEKKTLRRCLISIFSNGEEEMVRALLHKSGMSKAFTWIITPRSLEGRVKPEPEAFARMLKITGAEAERSLHIGNSISGDLAAARYGIWTIWWDFENSPVAWNEIENLHGKDAASRIFRVRTLAEVRQTINRHFFSVSDDT